jgi:lipoate-protein ligase A
VAARAREPLPGEFPRWWIFYTAPADPAANMAVDDALLEFAPRLTAPMLRLYSWNRPAATFGYFQKYADAASATRLRPLIRRPTGGGLVPHKRDWTYSFIAPVGHPWHRLDAAASYARMHQWIVDAFAALGLETELASGCHKEIPGRCFVGSEKFDILRLGKKIAGAAQRRTRDGLLIQGSIQPPRVKFSLHDWHVALATAAMQNWGITWQKFFPNDEVLRRMRDLTFGKYSIEAYNRHR